MISMDSTIKSHPDVSPVVKLVKIEEPQNVQLCEGEIEKEREREREREKRRRREREREREIEGGESVCV